MYKFIIVTLLLIFAISVLLFAQTEPNDANTIAYYKQGIGLTVTEDSVVTWEDQATAGSWDLTQSTSANRAAFDSDSIHLEFDATNDEYVKASFTDFDPVAGTVDIWVDARAEVGTRLIFQCRVDADNNVQFQRRAGDVNMIYKAGGTEENYVESTVDGWRLYTITWDTTANDTVNYYLDGVLKGQDGALGTWVGTPFIVIGSNDGSLFFDGSIGEVRISNKKRTTAETLDYYNYLANPEWSTYVDADKGDDGDSGLEISSPIKTIAKVNSRYMHAADNVKFRTDDTFTDATLLLPSSGTSGNVITITSYDSTGESGVDAILDGSTLADGWEVVENELITNGDFVDWADPAFPDDWTQDGTADGSNYTEESPADDLHLVSDGTYIGIKQSGVMTAGLSYWYEIKIDTVNSGGVRFTHEASPTVFSSAGTYTGLTISESFTVFELIRNGASDVYIDYIKLYPSKYTLPAVTTEPNLVVFDGTIGTNVADSSLVDTEKEWTWYDDTLYVYAADTSNIYYAQRTPIIDDNNQDYITVSNLTFQNSNGTGIFSDGTNNKFDNLTVRRHPTFGIDVNDNDITVSNNTITYSKYGIDNQGGGDNLIVEGNDISLSITTAENRGIYVAGGDGIVRYNWVHDLTNAADDGIRNNAAACSIYYNILSNIGSLSIHLAASDTNYVFNNSVYSGVVGIHMNNGSIENIIRNNILDGSSQDLNVAAAADSNNVGSNNIFVNDAGASGSGEYTGTNDLAATDPLFTDAANDNYILLPASPAIGKAYGWSQTRDYSNNSKSGSLWDIGALEYQAPAAGYETRYKVHINLWRYKRH